MILYIYTLSYNANVVSNIDKSNFQARASSSYLYFRCQKIAWSLALVGESEIPYPMPLQVLKFTTKNAKT